jgi:CO/xanthine dehydrogenase Mo-binding subunit
MSELSATVMNLPRRDAQDKLRGRTKYPNDRVRPDMLHAVLLRSTVAAGRIRKLDVSAALRCPGVRAVATGADAPGLYGIGIADHPLLAIDTIRYHGCPPWPKRSSPPPVSFTRAGAAMR